MTAKRRVKVRHKSIELSAKADRLAPLSSSVKNRRYEKIAGRNTRDLPGNDSVVCECVFGSN